MDKKAISEQLKIAFDLVQKSYLETSYLIKEVEGILGEEKEQFLLGGGNSRTARTSGGLDTRSVNLWPIRKMSVFFVEKEYTKQKSGVTLAPLTKDLKVIYLRIILNEKGINMPYIYSGVLYGFNKKSPPNDWPKKAEEIPGHIEYSEDRILKNIDKIDYKDVRFEFKGSLIKNNLLDINTSEDIAKKIVEPTLDLYRKV